MTTETAAPTQHRDRYELEDDDLLVHLGLGITADKYPGAVDAESFSVSMGPQHPSTHGVLRLQLDMDGEAVVGVRPYIGYLHRCFEKHAENLPYHEIVPFTDRMDYIAGMSQNWGMAVACERMMGLELPERVEYIRVIVGELQRIASHLIALGTYGLDLGAFTPFLWAMRDRERALDLLEWLTGARLLYNYIWVGGVAHELPDGWLEKCSQFVDYFEPKIDDFNSLLSYNHIFIERTANVGIVSPESAIDYGFSGPNLRASGVDFDIRRDEPYSIYDRLDWKVITGTGTHGQLGSCWDRYMVRIFEMAESLKLIRQATDGLPTEGDIHEKVPKKAKVPAGQAYVRTETPRGELGYFVIANGKDTPIRMKVRSPCFCAISALDAIVKTNPRMLIADLVAIIGSLDVVLGEIDR